MTTGYTCFMSVRARATSGFGVTARIGMSGRSREARMTLSPDSVRTIMAFAFMVLESWVADFIRASENVPSPAMASGSLASHRLSLSTREITFCCMATDSSGYLPAADSPESMTASAPSKIAVKMSEHSARVGAGLSIMDSSICVATITGFPWSRHSSIMSFWSMGTSSGNISTPRSPRATMMPSQTSTMDSRLSIASGFSILAKTLAGWSPMSFRSCSMSSFCWTKDSATQSKSMFLRQ
mmetsp:Transcript_17482/g.51109  ORF Transcript_17482/g.51109 Transcript_17482/m.51109 type:complete len:240 (-) Transcript_17482:741-1460(-)